MSTPLNFGVPPALEERRVASIGRLSGALFGGLTVAALLITMFIAEGAIGRPTSTSAVILAFVPIYGGIAALAGAVLGYLVGGIAELILRRRHVRRTLSISLIMVPAALGMIGAAVFATKNVVRYEEINQPRVVLSDGRIAKTPVDRDALVNLPGEVVFPWGEHVQTRWNDVIVFIYASDGAVRIEGVPDAPNIVTSLEDYDYIREAIGTAVELESGEEYLVVLAELRATGNRAVLLVYDSSGVLIYQELLERLGHATDLRVMDLGKDREGFVVLMNDAHLYTF
jgi:hypothetical protein